MTARDVLAGIKARKGGVPYLVGGVLYCGECNSSLTRGHARGCYGAPGAAEAMLVAAVEAVLDLHRPYVGEDSEDDYCDMDGSEWPCTVVRAITAALEAK